MAGSRRHDTGGSKAQYRSDRFIEHDGKWFFLTREGTTEGPFESRQDAVEMLEKWVSVQESGMLDGDASALSLMPKE